MVMESVAEEVQDNDLSDEGAVEAFESYAEVRKRLLDKKKARGFAPTPPARPGDEQRWKLSGSVNARLESLKSRTRCHLCKRLGHWKRECPGRRHAANDSAKKEAHLAEGEVLMTEGWDESFYMDVGGYAVAPQDVSLNPAGEFEPEVLSAEIGEAAAPAHRVFPEVFEAGNVANLDASGVPDTACRKTLVGEYTLECICKRLSDMGLRVKFAEESHVFRLGEHRLIIKANQGKPIACVDMSGYVTKEIVQMMDELSLEPVETDIAALDKKPDGSHDDAEAPVPGSTVMSEGKYKTKKLTFDHIYINDKDYINWVRVHIGSKSSRVMRQLKVYVAFRDEGKAVRIQQNMKEMALRKGSPKRTRDAPSRGSMEVDDWVPVDPQVTENAIHGWKWFTVNILASDQEQVKRMVKTCLSMGISKKIVIQQLG
ncbi:unnamed protein product [Symbiodinium necroappetens]|uniref:CCHC-type domain-containing protein n=1 Tax=Symbiodinium necroappetens TaxID=1628268 RepID=A0A813A546_9DINO|nr:unnamed protein product [Symbiodinium necroappetens]